MGTSNPRASSSTALVITVAAVGVALVVIVVSVFSRQHRSPGNTDEAPMSSVVVIPVEGMSCVACAARVKRTVEAIAGVGEAEVSLAERNARVRFDPHRVAPDQIVAAIDRLGYRAGTPTESK